MVRRYSIILSFVLATLLAAGGVELFYRSLSQSLTGGKEVTEPTKTGTAAGVKKNANANRSAPPLLSKRGGVKKKEDYSIIAKRALFGKVKEKPVAKPPIPQQTLAPTSLDLVLFGTISGTADDQRAFIRDKKKGKQDIYYVGDAIKHAQIKEISRGKIILTVNGKDEVLLMQEAKSPKGSANSKKNKASEIYSLADAMEKEKQSKPSSRQKRPAGKEKTLQLENTLR